LVRTQRRSKKTCHILGSRGAAYRAVRSEDNSSFEIIGRGRAARQCFRGGFDCAIDISQMGDIHEAMRRI
jgi:hypothetical protein